jgi:hypothetical protein
VSVQGADEFKVFLAFKAMSRARGSVAVPGDAAGSHQGTRFVSKHIADLVWRPDTELALFAFNINILC